MRENSSSGSSGGHETPPDEPIYETLDDADERARLVRRRMDDAKEDFARNSAEFEWWSDERYGDFFRSMWPREFGDLVPDKVLTRVRRAQHEALLAFKELLEYWIERTAPEKTSSAGETPLKGRIPFEDERL
jgi:hypothetical protein